MECKIVWICTVKREFGDDYTLVTTKGLEFPDSHGTKCLLQKMFFNL